MQCRCKPVTCDDIAYCPTGPRRAMRTTLECGHYRLLPWNVTVTGIGSYTACFVCADRPSRLVVNVEETGIPYWPSLEERVQDQ